LYIRLEYDSRPHLETAVWRIIAVTAFNKVVLHRTRLVVEWVTVFGAAGSRSRHMIHSTSGWACGWQVSPLIPYPGALEINDDKAPTDFRIKIGEIGLFVSIRLFGIPKRSGISQFRLQTSVCDDRATHRVKIW